MFTASRAQAQQIAPGVRHVCASALWGFLGAGALATSCYQAPAAPGAADMSSTPASLGAETSTQGTTNAPQTPGGTTTSPNVQTPDLSVGTMTISSQANPFLCLAAKDVSLGAPLTVATCDQSPGQRWLWQDMRLHATETLCLAFAASGTAALKTTPILATCNLQDQSQIIMRGSGAGLVAHSNGAGYNLAVQTPAASNGNVTFENIDPNQIGQRWILGSDSAASGSLLTGGFRIAALQGGNVQCLTVAANDTNIIYAPCTAVNAASQSFRWTESATLTHKESCLTAFGTNPVALVACNASNSNQNWYSINGFVQSVTGAGCLGTAQTTLGPCPATATAQMILGLPNQK